MLTVLDREIRSPAGAAQWLVRHDATGDHYIVSGVTADSGWEVLVFPADEYGNVTSWMEVGGGRGISHQEALDDLAGYISRKER